MRPRTSLSSLRFPGFPLLGNRKPGNRPQVIQTTAVRVSWGASERYEG